MPHITEDMLKSRFNETYNVNYEDLVEMGAGKVLVTESIGDYQGDYHYLVQDGTLYSHIVTGYGSCSGCDSLQACCSFEEIAELGNSICGGAIWHTRDRMIEHLKDHDAGGSWYGDKEDWKRFQSASLSILGYNDEVPEIMKFEIETYMVKNGKGIVGVSVGNTEIVRVGNTETVDLTEGSIQALGEAAQILKNTAKAMLEKRDSLKNSQSEITMDKTKLKAWLNTIDPQTNWNLDDKAQLEKQLIHVVRESGYLNLGLLFKSFEG